MGVHGRSGPRRQMEPLVKEVVELAKASQHALNCIFCTRSARGEAAHRVRDALIQGT